METRFPLDHGYLNCKTIGERAEFFLEVAGQDQGLYRGCLLGKNGHLDLGTLIPEGGKLRLRRSLPPVKTPPAQLLAGHRRTGGPQPSLFPDPQRLDGTPAPP